MKYTILQLSRKIDKQDGTPLLTKDKIGDDGKVVPGKPYMIVGLKVRHEGGEVWVSHYDYDGHTSDWQEGTEIEGTITEKEPFNGKPQYVFNRPNPEQKDITQKFLKRIKKDPLNFSTPVVTEGPKYEGERISVENLPF